MVQIYPYKNNIQAISKYKILYVLGAKQSLANTQPDKNGNKFRRLNHATSYISQIQYVEII